jgi:release factor glutamine methyltransferase
MSKIQPVPPPPPPAARIWTSLELINWTRDFFTRKGIASPRMEAELMLAEALGCPRIRLYVDFEKAVAPDKLALFREWVKRRGEFREPAQYIAGHSQFIDLKLKVSPAVLIPRPETEMLAVWALDRAREMLPPKPQPVPAAPEAPAVTGTEPAAPAEVAPTVAPPEPVPEIQINALDLCTGSGCLALYLAANESRLRLDATDISPEALAVAAENAQMLGLTPRVLLHCGDLFAALPADRRGACHLLVANPPYIDPAQRDTLQPEVRDHEPAKALFADDAGLGILRRIIQEAPDWLTGGGWLGLEFGMGQSAALQALAENTAAYDRIEIMPDNNRIPRFLIARRRCK